MLIGNPKAPDRNVLPEEKYNATNFMTLWEFDGVLKYSPLFYGWYESNSKGYRLAIAYFITGLVVYAYSFFATLRKMAENSRMSKLSEKDDECIFSWKLFTAWDYMIGNAETAHNRVASIVMGFKEALLEEAEKKKDTRNWRVIGCRVFVNLVVIGLLSLSVYLIILVVDRSTQSDSQNNFWRKNETSFVIALITFFFPMVFEVLGLLEQHHPRKQLRLQLARIMVLNLLNLYSLIYALIERISGMTEKLEAEWNITEALNKSSYLFTAPSSNMTKYYNETCIPCEENKPSLLVAESLISELRKNISIGFPLNLGHVMANLMAEVVAANDTLLNVFNGTYLENFAYFVEGLMLKVIALNDTLLNFPNGTHQENITQFDSELIFNKTSGNDTEMEFTDAKQLFVDYLTYILYSVDALYSTIIPVENSTTVNSDHNYSNTSAYYNYSTTNHYYNYTTTSNYYNYTTLTPEDNYTALETTTDFSNFKVVSEHFSKTIIPSIKKITELTTFTELTTSTELTKFVDLTEAIRFDTSTTTEDMLSTTIWGTDGTPDCVDCRKVWIPYKPNYTRKAELRNLCWETMFGQELVKLTVTDLFMSILPTLGMEFFRGIFVRVMNRCWCWDLEKIFPQYADFKVAENILALVNNQGIVWMGMFFSPGIVALNVAKLYILMYFRAWAVLTCNSPPEVIFRASRSHNFYYALLLMMLFLCVLPVGYTIVWIRPSWHCGPFRRYKKISHIFTETIKENSPERFWKVLDYIASPGIVIPLLVLLTLIIYYLVSLTSALREANDDLKIQLRRERTEERRKMFQMSDRRRRVGSGESNELSNTPFSKWKKVLGNLPSGKSMDETPKPETDDIPEPVKEENGNKSKDFFTKLIKRALGKSSTSEEEQNAEDGTDTEQHDSLPYDTVSSKKGLHKSVKPTFSWGKSDFQTIANKAMQLKKSNPDPNVENSVTVVEPKLEKSSSNRQNTDLRRDVHRKKSIVNRNEPSTSDNRRQDSETSIRSEQIPVITISKTESAENILRANMPSLSEDNVEKTTQQKFAPKIKCALKKQSAEVDEETIRYFSRDIEESQTEIDLIKALADDTVEGAEKSSQRKMFFETLDNLEEPLTDISSSEGTEYRESSTDTVLHSPIIKKE